MVKGLVTVVVPIYNVEKYLDRCVESIINQTYKNLEIVLIDDESPDRCPEMCQEWEKRDTRIRVVHKKNQGLGMARNTGIDYAHGEYICFFDSDDYIELNTIEETYKVANMEEADIVCFGLYLENHNSEYPKVIKAEKMQIFKGKECIRQKFIPGMMGKNPETGSSLGVWQSLWGGLFSMRLIHKTGWRCKSEKEIISEDIYSLLELYSNVECAVVLDRAFYHYCENATSLTRVYKEDRYERIKIFYEKCTELCDELEYSSLVKHQVCHLFLGNTIATLKQIAASDNSFINKYKLFQHIVNDELLQNVLREVDKDIVEVSKKILCKFLKWRIYFVSYGLVVIRGWI